MASRVFFSFHYEDVKTFRADVVRNHSVTKERGEAGFFDASIWEDGNDLMDHRLAKPFELLSHET